MFLNVARSPLAFVPFCCMSVPILCTPCPFYPHYPQLTICLRVMWETCCRHYSQTEDDLKAVIKPQYVDKVGKVVKGTVGRMLSRKDELDLMDVSVLMGFSAKKGVRNEV